MQFEDVVSFLKADFAPNRLVGFLKSKNSYHGVQPIACPDGMVRNSLNINVNCASSVNELLYRAHFAMARFRGGAGRRAS